MLKHSITFTDYDGNEVTEVHHFNISDTELVELEVEYENGLGAALQRIVETNDRKRLIAEFKKIILLAYGIREGNRFIKTDELRDQFTQTAAYNALFMQLAMDDQKAGDFINAVIPAHLNAAADQDKPQGPPPAPLAPPVNEAAT